MVTHHQAACQHPTQSADKAAEEKPEDVADRFHRNTSLVVASQGDWFYLKRKFDEVFNHGGKFFPGESQAPAEI